MNYENLDRVIQYVEKNLYNKIELKEISKIMGMNEFIFQRVFMFITGVTFNDYVKKRRLSKAYEEIKNTNNKIIDISLKYQYNSVGSFNRAFKKLFGITPTECRKSNKFYQVIPIFNFENQINNEYVFNYEIQDIDEFDIYCKFVESSDYSNLLFEIRKLYEKIKENGEYNNFVNFGYAIFINEKSKYFYYLGSKEKNSNLFKVTIKSGKYAVFKVNSTKQSDILDLTKKIYKQWFFSVDFQVGDNSNFEYYENGYCYIYVSIK